MPDVFDPLPFAIDHIRPRYHHGPTTAENLCVSCFNCNTFKAVNVAGHDPDTGELTPLFHPRSDDWNALVAKSKFKDMEHFKRPPMKGHICLQDHTARIEYRNIKIRPLPKK